MSLRDRLARVEGVTWAVLAITLVALATRVVDLGVRAVHHDESLHLFYAWELAQGRGYEHHPLMHGPLQFHLVAAFFLLFGDSEFTGRLSQALAGTALVATPLLFRRWLNGPSVVLAALFLLLSPSLLYYARFARNEPYVLLCTALMVWAILEYRRTGGLRPLVVYAAVFALHAAAKETVYLVTAVMLLYLNAWAAHDLFWGPRRARGEQPSMLAQLRAGAVLFPVAWVIALLWSVLGPLRARFGWQERPRSVDLLVLTIALVLPLLSAASQLPFTLAGVELDLDAERRLGAVAVTAMLLLSTAIGFAWNWRRWAICMAVGAAILVPLYTTLGTNPSGAAGIVWTSLDYWIDQQDVARGNQPWFYYVWMLSLYELLTLAPVVILGPWLVIRRRDWVSALFLFWFAGMFLGLSYAGEKMPWLTGHIALPLAFLAAHALGRRLPEVWAAARVGRGAAWRWMAGSAAATALVLLAALTVQVDRGLNWEHPDTPVEPMIYVQTSPEVPVLAREIRGLIEDGIAERVVIHTDQSMTWPWAWYLRGLPTLYVEDPEVDVDELGPTDVLLVREGAMPHNGPLLDLYAEPEPYVHRWWFQETGYRSTSWADLREGLSDGTLLPAWWDFLLHRGDPEAVGELWSEIYVPVAASTAGG